MVRNGPPGAVNPGAHSKRRGLNMLPYRCRICDEEFEVPEEIEMDCPACGAGPMNHEPHDKEECDYQLSVELTEGEWLQLKVALDWMKEAVTFWRGKSDQYYQVVRLEEKIYQGCRVKNPIDITKDDLPF